MLDMIAYMSFDYDDTLLNVARHLSFDDYGSCKLVQARLDEVDGYAGKGGNLND